MLKAKVKIKNVKLIYDFDLNIKAIKYDFKSKYPRHQQTAKLLVFFNMRVRKTPT